MNLRRRCWRQWQTRSLRTCQSPSLRARRPRNLPTWRSPARTRLRPARKSTCSSPEPNAPASRQTEEREQAEEQTSTCSRHAPSPYRAAPLVRILAGRVGRLGFVLEGGVVDLQQITGELTALGIGQAARRAVPVVGIAGIDDVEQ